MRRAVQQRNRIDSFENSDPERLRLTSSEADPKPSAPAFTTYNRPGGLRYLQRWSAEIDGLDAASSFLCGDRLVLATPKHTLALDCDGGEVLWSQPAVRATYFMTGAVLLRLLSNGEAELCNLEHGEVFGRCRVAPRLGGAPLAVSAGGGALPPVAIITEGRQRLAAIDLRTGEPRWRYRARGTGPFRLRRAGRIVLVTCGADSVDALEVASGELLWRFADPARFCSAPAICGEAVIAAAGEANGGPGALFGIELFSGRLLWKQKLEAAAAAAPLAAGDKTALPVGGPRHSALACFDSLSGAPLWNRRDPGLCGDGAALAVDGSLIINTPSGRVTSLDLETGETLWARALSDPLTDDVPRQLEPVLRNGALFTPAARVHVLRPADGAALTTEMPCDLVPDWLRVDDRGWMYVAEESGHLRAYAPVSRLSLVR